MAGGATPERLRTIADALGPALRPLEIDAKGSWIELSRPGFSQGFDASILDRRDEAETIRAVVSAISEIATKELGEAWPFDAARLLEIVGDTSSTG